MKKFLILSLILITALSSCKKKPELHMVNIPQGRGVEKAEAFGIQLSMQSSTFADTTLVDLFKDLEELGIKSLEVSPNHIIGGKWGSKRFNQDLYREEIESLKEIATQHDVKIVGLGVYRTENESDWAEIFSFAQSVGVEYIVAEPNSKHLETLSKLSVETDIRVSIYNGLQPSEYWKPSLFLEKTKDYNDDFGACADVANWSQGDLDHIECLEQLSGKLQSIYLRDISYKKHNEEGLVYQEDITWGNGILDVDAMIMELKRQKYKGYITIKFEKKSERLMQELKDCIFYYDLVTDEFI